MAYRGKANIMRLSDKEDVSCGSVMEHVTQFAEYHINETRLCLTLYSRSSKIFC